MQKNSEHHDGKLWFLLYLKRRLVCVEGELHDAYATKVYCAQKETHVFNVAISNELFD